MQLNEINAAQKLGNVTRTPTLRETGDSVVTTLSIATHRRWRNGEEMREATDFLDIVAWGKLAEYVVTHVRQGARVYAEGDLRSRKYVDAKGQERTTVEMNAEKIILINPAPPSNQDHVEEAEDVFAE